MSTGHNDKEYLNRLARRAEAHGLHIEQSEVQDETDPNYGTFLLRDVQTGAVAHQAQSDSNRDYGLNLKQVEDYLNGRD